MKNYDWREIVKRGFSDYGTSINEEGSEVTAYRSGYLTIYKMIYFKKFAKPIWIYLNSDKGVCKVYKYLGNVFKRMEKDENAKIL